MDAESSASLAAYINSLTYALEDDSGWFTKGTGWKVRSGCYWCVCLRATRVPFVDLHPPFEVVSMHSQEWMYVWMSRYLEVYRHMWLTYVASGEPLFTVPILLCPYSYPPLLKIVMKQLRKSG